MAKDKGIEGTGFDVNDRVTIPDAGVDAVKGIVVAAHAGGKQIDVHIGHPGHKNNGRIVTVDTSDVTAVTDAAAAKSDAADAKAEAAKD